MGKRFFVLSFLTFFVILFADTKWRGGYCRQLATSTAESPPPAPPPVDSIGAEWNLTGNPIGGGPGYSDSVRHQDADYYVTTKAQLLTALTTASSGDIIYIADSAKIDLSLENTIVVPSGITLASGRGRTLADTISWGALIHHDSVGWEFEEMFRTGGENVRVTGLRFRGPYSEMEGGRSNDSFPVVTTYAVAVTENNTEIDNCEFWGWSYASIGLKWGSPNTYIHHNHIFGMGHFHLGYGIVVGGNTGTSALIEANYLDFCRHAITGGGDTLSPYEARYNIILDHCEGHSIDRHGTYSDSGMCAPDHVHHNTIRSVRKIGMWRPGHHIRGIPVDTLKVYNNWYWISDSANTYNIYNNGGGFVKIWDEQYGTTPPDGLSSRIPTANIVANVDSGDAPLTVTFKATGSFDPDGELRGFYWAFGKDAYARFTNINDSVTLTYDTIGIYRVELMVTDNDGCVAKEWHDVNVAPTDGKNWLSAWVKDRYHGNLTGYFYKQILIDDVVIWTDDIAGDEGWMHIVKDISSECANKDSVSISFRLICMQDCDLNTIERNMYVDDVVLYGADVPNGNMESQTDWIYGENSTIYYGEWVDGTVRSGNRAYYFGQPWSYISFGGDWAEIYQKVAVE